MTKVQLIPSGVVLFVAGFGLGFWLLPGPDGTTTDDDTSSPGPASETPGAPGSRWDAALGREPRFTDVTRATGIDFRHENGLSGQYRYIEIMGGGVGLFDYDGDGDLDIYFVNGNHLADEASPRVTNRLFRNDGAWRFRDVTAAAGVGDAGYGQGCCVGDYDNDGDVDLYVTNYGPNVLYRNDGDGTFTDVTAAAGLADPGWGQSCSFLDYDGDGRLDLYVENYLTFDASRSAGSVLHVGKEKTRDYPSPLGFRGSPDRLYRGHGDGTFTDVTETAGLLRPDGKGMGVACADFDDDGRTDIFVANDSAENYLFLNRGEGRFEEVGLIAGVAYGGSGAPEASMGVDVGDFDQDGRLDLIVPCLRHEVFTLYRNLGNGFSDRSIAAGLAQATAQVTGFNANFIDYDNDGDLDLFFTNGGVRRNENAAADDSYSARYGLPDLLLAADGQGHFSDVSRFAGPYFQRSLIGRGSAVGDLDGDGDLDLVVSNLADRAVILRNDTVGGHWLRLDLVAAAGRQYPGTSVRLEAGGRRQRADVHGGVSYLSQSDRRLHFGLGAATRVDRLEIRWPGGKTQVVEGVAADRVVRVVQE